MSDTTYLNARSGALQRTGAIRELRREAYEIRQRIREGLDKRVDVGGVNQRVHYDWIERQLARARRFDADADVLETNRPSRAGGLST